MTDSGSSQPPGWYYAQGDPPGTQRYWDGAQWQGAPQATAPATPSAEPGYNPMMSGGRRRADAGKRFIAYLIDVAIIIGIYIVGLILIAIGSGISDGLGAVFSVLLAIAYIGYAIYNFLYLQGTTGQTIGKRMQGITLLRQDNGQPVGIGMAFVRGILQAIFAIPCYLDHWWILVDEDNQRLSDKVLKFHVYDA
ncbi:MAG: RDD family protein [Actinomycetota bacterium]